MPYKVSLLSTEKDLSEYRNAIGLLLKNYGFEVLAFEDPSGTGFLINTKAHSHDTCLQNVERCDIAVVILNKRYGGKYKGSKSSITEKEWQTAIDKQKIIVPLIAKKAYFASTSYQKTKKAGALSYFDGTKEDKHLMESFVSRVRKHSTNNFCIFFKNIDEAKSEIEKHLKAISADILISVGNIQLIKLGSSRTSMPFDISIEEAIKEGLYIAPRYTKPGSTTIYEDDLAHQIISNLSDKKSVLVLGEPGGGKTSFLYFTMSLLLEANRTSNGLSKIPIYIDIPEYISQGDQSFSVDSILEYAFLKYNHSRGKYPLFEISKSDLIFLFDGLDEALNLPKFSFSVDRLFLSEAIECTHAICCRTYEFKNSIASASINAQYNSLFVLAPWDTDKEIPLYASYLRNHVDHESVEVFESFFCNNKERFFTPLMVRMIAFICTEIGSLKSNNRSYIYNAYFANLISREISRRDQFNAQELKDKTATVLEHIEEMTLSAFIKGRYYLTNNADGKDCFSSSICNSLKNLLFKEYDNENIQFIHNSYYEYFSAKSVVNAICRDHDAGEKSISRHIPKETRGFLLDILSNTRICDDVLIFSEKILNSLSLNIIDYTTEKLESLNMIYYLLGNLNDDKSLDLLIRDNVDEGNVHKFVLSSCYWARTRRAVAGAEGDYLSKLLASESETDGFDALNRGYHLFYYSEYTGSNKPPYIDNQQSQWERTKSFLLKFLKYDISKPNPHYLLDAYTFLRFAETRGYTLERSEVATILAAISWIEENRQSSEDAKLIGRRLSSLIG